VVAAGLVALLLVAGNVPGGPVPAASASSSDGSLSGTVTEAGNAGTIAPAVCVYAAAQGGPPSYNTTTAANGSYQFADIAAGQYSVWFDPTCKGAQTSPYATQYYDDVPDISAATWVTVPGGGSVGGIDADLALAGTISGLVSGPSGPLQGVCVIAYDSVDGDEVGATTTASNGGYSVQLPPEGYLVQFDPTCRAVNTYASQFYDDVPDAYAASKSNTNVVEVTGGATQTANATLQPGGTVEGTVVAPGATSSAGTCVIAYDPGGDQIGAVLTNASGNYELTDLPAQTYRIVFDPTCNDGQPSDFQLEAYGSLPVAAGQTVAGINGTLALVACLVAPYVTTTSLPAGSVSAPYSATLQASGGTGPYTWTAVGLPTSLSLDTATGAISGAPSAPFDGTVTVTATDSSQQPVSSHPQQLVLSVTGPSSTTSSTTTTTSSTSTSSTTTTTSTTTTSTTTTSPTTTSTTTSSTTTTSTTVPAATCPGNGGGGGSGVVFPVVLPTTTTSTVPSTATTTLPPTTTPPPLPVLPPGAPKGAYTVAATATVATGPTALAGTAGNANAHLSVPAGALPAGTVLSIDVVKDASALKRQVPPGQSYLISFAVSWVAPDGTSPVASKPVTMTIVDPAIMAGDTIYALTSTGIRAVGTATTNGTATVSFTSDPAFVVAAVPRLGAVGTRASLRSARIEVGVACAAGTTCTGTASLSVTVGKAGAKRNVPFAKGKFVLGAGQSGHLSLSVSGAGRTLLRSGGGKLEELSGKLTIALLGGQKTEHRIVVR
jgi:hypothetical protein